MGGLSKYAPLILIAIGVFGLTGQMQGCDFESLPIPSPGPDPVVTEGSWVIVIEETEERTPAITKVLNDTKWWESLKERGLKWRIYDIDAEHDYAAIANSVGLPAVAIVLPTGKVLHKGKLPESVEQLDQTIKRVTAR